jgi:Protein of unknown function (DUF664)
MAPGKETALRERSDRAEREDLVATLDKHRGFLRYAVRGLSDAQARERTTVSELCLGGLVKHVTLVEERWARFIQVGPSAFGGLDQAAAEEHASSFKMEPGETLSGLLDDYGRVANRTDASIAELDSLDAAQPLPEAPWFERAEWSARRVVLHVLAETAQHAGHADILREALDGSKTMG